MGMGVLSKVADGGRIYIRFVVWRRQESRVLFFLQKSE